MFGRRTEGAVVCPSCGNLVGVRDNECLSCGRRNPGLWGFAPLLAAFGRGRLDDAFVQFVVVTCAVLYVASLAVDISSIQMGGLLNFLSPSRQGLFLFGASGAFPVFGLDRWWTVLSATWLHGGLIHIFFNMYWVKTIGPALIEFYGLGRMIIIYVVAGVSGFLITSTVGYMFPFAPSLLSGASDMTIGASASIFGLIGSLLYYGRRTGSSAVYQQARQWAIFLFIFGLIFPGIDNWAHLGGFAGGYFVSAWLDPLQPERLDHTLGAVACLVLSALSIVLSVVHGLQFIR